MCVYDVCCGEWVWLDQQEKRVNWGGWGGEGGGEGEHYSTYRVETSLRRRPPKNKW